jgi:hypothetical protein
MITRAQRANLRNRGYTDEQIRGLTPQQAHEILAGKGNGAAASWPVVCEHCGGQEQPDNPVQECWIAGDLYRLHRHCQAAWLAGPGREPGED